MTGWKILTQLLAETSPAVVSYDPAFSYEVGHIVKDCPNAGTKTCYKCGGIGHILRDCPSRV